MQIMFYIIESKYSWPIQMYNLTFSLVEIVYQIQMSIKGFQDV